MSEKVDLSAAAEPERLVAAIAANTAGEEAHAGHGSTADLVSVRTATHNGHEIVVRTAYEIEVDGRPFAPHVVVDNDGRVHYHGLPTSDFASMVGLVQKAIDEFPQDFPGLAGPGPGPEPGPGHGHHDGRHRHDGTV